ncbi:MAG TPA: hypothetical protein VFQ45_18485 [Longimicrobium sp.]|nr:hypothetical protein [Longimicrobium sp.]
MKFSSILTVLLLCVAGPLAAQRHAVTDQSLARSILFAAPSLPMSTHQAPRDTAGPAIHRRVEIAHSLLMADGLAAPVLVAGFRVEDADRDTLGTSAAVAGARIAAREAADGWAVSALEFSVGGRSVVDHGRPLMPVLGMDLVVGWGSLEEEPKGHLGLRFPAEWVRRAGPGWMALTLMPTMAWGHVHFRGCTDRGSGDNCGDLGVQLEFGRTRFLLAGGATVGLEPSRVTLSLAAQELFAAGQDPRVSLGLSWTP